MTLAWTDILTPPTQQYVSLYLVRDVPRVSPYREARGNLIQLDGVRREPFFPSTCAFWRARWFFPNWIYPRECVGKVQGPCRPFSIARVIPSTRTSFAPGRLSALSIPSPAGRSTTRQTSGVPQIALSAMAAAQTPAVVIVARCGTTRRQLE